MTSPVSHSEDAQGAMQGEHTGPPGLQAWSRRGASSPIGPAEVERSGSPGLHGDPALPSGPQSTKCPSGGIAHVHTRHRAPQLTAFSPPPSPSLHPARETAGQVKRRCGSQSQTPLSVSGAGCRHLHRPTAGSSQHRQAAGPRPRGPTPAPGRSVHWAAELQAAGEVASHALNPRPAGGLGRPRIPPPGAAQLLPHWNVVLSGAGSATPLPPDMWGN